MIIMIIMIIIIIIIIIKLGSVTIAAYSAHVLTILQKNRGLSGWTINGTQYFLCLFLRVPVMQTRAKTMLPANLDIHTKNIAASVSQDSPVKTVKAVRASSNLKLHNMSMK